MLGDPHRAPANPNLPAFELDPSGGSLTDVPTATFLWKVNIEQMAVLFCAPLQRWGLSRYCIRTWSFEGSSDGQSCPGPTDPNGAWSVSKQLHAMPGNVSGSAPDVMTPFRRGPEFGKRVGRGPGRCCAGTRATRHCGPTARCTSSGWRAAAGSTATSAWSWTPGVAARKGGGCTFLFKNGPKCWLEMA